VLSVEEEAVIVAFERHTATAARRLPLGALETAISKATLTHWGWRIVAAGRIITDTGHTVFAAGFVTAIGKVLEGQQSGRARNI
jgi:hypothetical protein